MRWLAGPSIHDTTGATDMSRQAFRSLASIVFGASFFLAIGSAAAANAASPAFKFYLDYLEHAAAAERLEDISGYMPSWWNDRQQSASAEDKAAAVDRIRKASLALKEVSLQREEPADGGVRLQLTARTDGIPMTGSVLLVKESGTFKVEESMWRSVEPIVN